MSKNKKSDLSKIIINMENDKIIYRDTGKSLVIPYEGGNVNQTNPPKYFTDFATKVETFMETQIKFNDKVETFMENQIKFNKNVANFMEQQLRFNEKIWNKVEAISNCPTIKKELADTQKERS